MVCQLQINNTVSVFHIYLKSAELGEGGRGGGGGGDYESYQYLRGGITAKY